MAFDADPDWDEADPFNPPASCKPPPRRLSAGEDRVTAIVLLVFLLVHGAILSVLILFENLTFDASRVNERRDGTSVLDQTIWIVPAAVALSVLATISGSPAPTHPAASRGFLRSARCPQSSHFWSLQGS